MVFPQIGLQQLRPSVVQLLLGWGTGGDIADGEVLVGVVMLSRWVGKGCIDPPMKEVYGIINIFNQAMNKNGINEYYNDELSYEFID